jgi:hypothetical protein
VLCRVVVCAAPADASGESPDGQATAMIATAIAETALMIATMIGTRELCSTLLSRW